MKPDRWQRLLPLLDRALQADGDGRHRFLDALDASDQDLRPDLERLLAEHHRQGSRSSPNAMELAAPAFADRLEEELELDQGRVGERIGPYRLVSLLGTGGMGAVYLAERTEHGFTQVVALKLVRKSLGRIASERFERERQILAGLKHPGIAQLFDGGQTAEGRSFYTMEYVEGEAITDYCERRALAPKERVRLLLDVVTTLSYAHQNLVVHRDIKPSNVLVTREGRVKLIDFGLAKLLDEHAMPSVTQTGLGPMTPVYAAPEQFHSKPTTVATDIYQFGVLSFLVFTGGLPYRTDPHDSLEWARAVCEEEPATLMSAADAAKSAGSGASATVPISRSRHRLSKDLDAIVRKCLAKSPDRRYRSADALISDLQAFLADRPVAARLAGPFYFVWRFVQRRRYVVGATVLAVVALGAVGIVAFEQSRVAAKQAERAAREAEVRNVTRAMLTDLLRVGPASAASERPHSALEALDQGAERTLRALGTNEQHRAIATSVLAESYLQLDHPLRARELIEKTLPLLEERDELRIDRLQLNLLLARSAAALGDLATSERMLMRVDTNIEAIGLPKDAPSRLAADLVRVRLTMHQGDLEASRKMEERLLRESDHAGLNETLEFADLLRASAEQVDDDSLGTNMLERAWTIVAAHYGKDSPAALAAQRVLIEQDLFAAHRLDTDQILAEQATRVRESFGEKSLDYADILRIRCVRNEMGQQYSDAETCYREALAIYEQAPDSEIVLATMLDNLAAVLVRLRRPQEALPFYERELALRSKTYAPSYPNVVHARLQVAKTRCLVGDFDNAYREFDAAIVDYVASVGPRHPYEAVYAAYFATCLLDANRGELARSVMEKHAQLEPPRKNMTAEDRADVVAVWKRVAK